MSVAAALKQHLRLAACVHSVVCQWANIACGITFVSRLSRSLSVSRSTKHGALDERIHKGARLNRQKSPRLRELPSNAAMSTAHNGYYLAECFGGNAVEWSFVQRAFSWRWQAGRQAGS